MNFGEALAELKKDRWVRRAGWNGKNMHLYLEEHMSWPVPGGVFKGEVREYEPCICLFNAQGKHQPGWNASQPDMLAEDWEVVPQDEMR